MSIGYVGTIKFVNGVDEEDLGQIIRKEYGPGIYDVMICEAHLGCARIVNTINVKVLPNSPEQPSKPDKPKKPFAKARPVKKVVLKTKPPDEPRSEDADVFSAAIRGGLFKKDIEEP
jgi:hypothetical protein